MMQIWRDEPDSDCAWAGGETERWYGVGEPGKQSWPVPEAVAVKLMQMGAEAQRAKTRVIKDVRGLPDAHFDDINPIEVLHQEAEGNG